MGAKPPYGYTGHRYESELGLTDAGGRFYDAKFGIFLSPDPIGPLNGGSAFGNRYSYVGYDPINFVDPTGFNREEIVALPEEGIDCLSEPNHPTCKRDTSGSGLEALLALGGGTAAVVVVSYWACSESSDCTGAVKDIGTTLEGWGKSIKNWGILDGNFTGPKSQPKAHIANTADGQIFGVAASADSSSSGSSRSNLILQLGTPSAAANLPTLRRDYAGSLEEGFFTASMVPGIGEGWDAYILTAEDSSDWERGFAGASLSLNSAVPILPNFGGVARALKVRAANGVSKIKGGPNFPSLKDHARRHSNMHPNAYYNEAVRHTQTGRAFKLAHDGETRIAHITRVGEDKFLFTARDVSGKTIFTHHDNVTTQYLQNIGVTLPKGF